MRPRRALRSVLAALQVALVGACWASCSASSGGTGSGDAGNAGDATTDAPITDDSGCDPCQQVCSCTLGDMFANPGHCTTEFCSSGSWGGPNYCMPNGCAEADAGADAGCDPCTMQCHCVTSEPPRFDYSHCKFETCTTGTWGPHLFCPGNACDGGNDASNDASDDVIPDVASDTAAD